MLHAAAMLIGFFLLGLLLFSRDGFAEAAVIAGAISIVCVTLSWRLGGLGASIWAAPQSASLALARAPAVVAGAIKTVRAALAADVTVRPALVRVKLRLQRDHARTVMADLSSMAPGAVVVDTEEDAILVHVMDEDDIDAVELGALEARIADALDGRRG